MHSAQQSNQTPFPKRKRGKGETRNNISRSRAALFVRRICGVLST
jgi:hypothetical protein